MFWQDQFLHWRQKLNLTERAESLIQQIKSSNPSWFIYNNLQAIGFGILTATTATWPGLATIIDISMIAQSVLD